MSTIGEVAKRAGVSAMTVSRVINGHPHVSEGVRTRVEQAIKELHYSPNLTAKTMRGKRAFMIGVLIPDFLNPFYSELLKHLETALQEHQYHLIISTTNHGDEEETVKYLISRNVDAVVISSYAEMKQGYRYLTEHYPELPAVILDQMDQKGKIHSIYPDGYEGIRVITEHLLELGHQRIGIIKASEQFPVSNVRFQGYRDALEHFDPQLVFEGDYSLQSGRDAGKYFLSLSSPPTAVIGITDFMAIGAMNYLTEHGVQVPKEIAVAGFDGIYITELVTPPLTTYQFPLKEMAQKVTEVLMNEINFGKTDVVNFSFQGKLMIRKSTKFSY